MQSIYRFRAAEGGLFLRARDHGIGDVRLTPLRLAANFRATEPLVAWNNMVFERVFPADDDLRAGAIAFSASVARVLPEAGAAAAAPVRLRVFPDDPAGEAAAIVSRIVELRRDDPRGTVAVLVAAHAHAVAVVTALREAHVDIRGVDLVPLAERPIVRDLVQLTRALHDLGDRAAWLAVLRAPWCGASLAALTALSGLDEPQLIWEALNDDARLARCAPRELERPLLRWIDLPSESGPTDLLVAPAPGIGEEEGGELAAYIGRLHARRNAHERTRLMYVAATRARRTLCLSGAPRSRADGSVAPEARTLLGCLWPVLGERFASAEPRASPAGAAAPIPPPRAVTLRRLREGWRPPELPPATPLPHLPLGRASLDPREFSWVGETQRHVGTVVHAFLARLADSAPLPTPEALEGAREAVARQLGRAGVPEREQDEATRQVLAALARTVADERGRWLLGAGHREASSELALTGLAAGRLRSVVIDRCFVDERCTSVRVDHETSRHEGGGLESFLAEELERYRGQLSTYAALAQQLGPEPVRAALYFPLLRAFRELS